MVNSAHAPAYQTRNETLAVHERHHLRGVARARGSALRKELLDSLEIFRRKDYIHPACIFVEILDALRTGNCDDFVALRQNPRKRQLRRGTGLLVSDFSDVANEIKILLEVLSLESWRLPAIVVGR